MIRLVGLAGLVCMFGGVAYVADNARTAAHDAKEAVQAAEIQDQRLYESQLAGCQRGISDRRIHREQAHASSVANWIVARDPHQPERTRRARLVQAKANDRAVRSFDRRLPPRLVCSRDVTRP